MDTLQLRVSMGPDTWGRPEPMATIHINGQCLAQLVREVELPFASREGHPDLAGQYVGLPAHFLTAPSRYLLGEVSDGPWCDPERVVLLQCECGEWGCWPLLARITLKSETVVWRSFKQPHRWTRTRQKCRLRRRSRRFLRKWASARIRAWRYSRLGPFVFSRPEYEAALSQPQIAS
jgi:hypothetical protein